MHKQSEQTEKNIWHVLIEDAWDRGHSVGGTVEVRVRRPYLHVGWVVPLSAIIAIVITSVMR